MTDRIVAEITLTVDAGGTTQTFYMGTSGYATKPTDTPANTYIAPRIKSVGSFRRELFSGSRVTGAVRPSFGEIVLMNGDGGLDAWMGYAISGSKVTVRIGDENAAYPAGYTTVYVAYAQHLVADFSEIRLRLRDRLNLLDQPLITSQFTGAGGLEGSTGMAGKLKQWVSSDPCWFPPILIDAASQLYFVQSTGTGGLSGLFAIYEGGIAITRGTDYPDAATCISTSPAAGQARFWFGTGGNGPVYVRLGSVPQLDLRVNGFGYQTSGSAWTFSAMAAQAGISGGTGAGAVGAQYVDDSRTYLDVMEAGCTQFFIYFGMTRLDAFVSAVFNVPGVTASYSFNQHNAKSWTRTPVQDMDAPVWSLTANVGKTYPGNVAAGASATNKEIYQRAPWWSSVAKTDAAVKTANPGAVAAVVSTDVRAFSNTTDQTTFTTGYFTRYGVRRDFYTCTVPLDAATISLELHDTVEIKLPRFGLNSGKKMRIITQQIDCDKRQITYGMWG
jgi:hypothetical protein